MCVFVSVGLPCVAQRICRMSIEPCRRSAASLPSRFLSLPLARRRASFPFSRIATRAES